jgi:hypothetical protein
MVRFVGSSFTHRILVSCQCAAKKRSGEVSRSEQAGSCFARTSATFRASTARGRNQPCGDDWAHGHDRTHRSDRPYRDNWPHGPSWAHGHDWPYGGGGRQQGWSSGRQPRRCDGRQPRWSGGRQPGCCDGRQQGRRGGRQQDRGQQVGLAYSGRKQKRFPEGWRLGERP